MRLVPCTLLLAAGCEGCAEGAAPTLTTLLRGEVPVTAQADPSVGEGLDVEVPVRLRNAWGAAVPGGGIDVDVNGPSAVASAATVEPDALGYGRLAVHTSGPEAFTVEVTGAPGRAVPGEVATAWTTGGPIPFALLGQGWDPGVPLPPDQVAAATGGVLAARDEVVWWVPARAGAPAHRILEAPDPVIRLATLHLDGDGVLDALVGTRSAVFLLRGRRDGGMGWGAGFEAEGRTVRGAGAGDVDGDHVVDVLVVLAGSEGDWLDVWAGDGAWGFEHLESQVLPCLATDAWAADGNGDGLVEMDVLTEDAVLERYARTSGSWAETWPSGMDPGLTAPATLLGAADLDGGGMSDILLLAAEEMGEPRDLSFYVMEGEPVRYGLTFEDPFPAVGDLTGDGIADLVVGEGDHLVCVSWELEADTGDGGAYTFVRDTTDTVAGDGPIAVLDADGDGKGDVVVAANRWRLWAGDAEAVRWAPRDGAWASLPLSLLAVPEPVHLGGVGRPNGLLAWVEDGGTTELVLWRILPEGSETAPGLSEEGHIALPAGALPLDLVTCGDQAFGLTDDGTLVAVRFDSGAGLVERARFSVEGYTRLACGTFPGVAVLAVARPDGSALLTDAVLSAMTPTDLGPLEDMAAADPDGDGIDDIVTCAAQGCRILGADTDGDGRDEVYRVEDGVFTDDASGATEDGEGELTAVDLDGDGRLEIVAGSPRGVEVHRPVEGGLAPCVDRLTSRDLAGPVRFTDWSGDGVTDLLAPAATGALYLLAGDPAP